MTESATRGCALAIMTKEPRAGLVKTRLSPTLTPEEAAELNRCFLRDMTAAIEITVRQSNAAGCAVYTPEGAAESYAKIIPPEFHLVPQRGDALGGRIIFAMEDLFQLGFSSVCLIGSDSPTIPPPVFTEAVAVLEEPENMVVLGPTKDGGYYLVGLNTRTPSLFQDIAWSTEKVLEQTCARARQMNLKVHLLPTWYDVDDAGSLQLLCEELFTRSIEPGTREAAPATRAYLESLGQRKGWTIGRSRPAT
jgi:uncharacterized protein